MAAYIRGWVGGKLRSAVPVVVVTAGLKGREHPQIEAMTSLRCKPVPAGGKQSLAASGVYLK
jgi:hypothetical protein